MPPQIITWIRGLNPYVMWTIIVLIFLSSLIFFPVIFGGAICYKIYESELHPVFKYSLIAVVCIVAFAAQMFWIGHLKKQFYPNVPALY
jgi:Trk-type K+ transport system membrane component